MLPPLPQAAGGGGGLLAKLKKANAPPANPVCSVCFNDNDEDSVSAVGFLGDTMFTAIRGQVMAWALGASVAQRDYGPSWSTLAQPSPPDSLEAQSCLCGRSKVLVFCPAAQNHEYVARVELFLSLRPSQSRVALQPG